MGWNGLGTYSPPAASFPEVNGTTIDATRFNATINDLATGITAALAKNGENSPSANLPMGGYKHTGAAAANASGQYLLFGQSSAELASLAVSGALSSAAFTATGNVLLNGGTLIFNEAGADLDARFEGDTDANLLFLDAGNDRIGIGTATPGTKFDLASGQLAIPAGAVGTPSLAARGDLNTGLYFPGADELALVTGGTARLSISSTGVVTYGSLEIGFRDLPAASVTTGAFVAADNGKCVYATGGVTIPNSTMAAEDVVVVQNTTGSSITVTKSITTAYNTGTGSALGATFTLTARGRMAIVFTSATECYVSGNIS